MDSQPDIDDDSPTKPLQQLEKLLSEGLNGHKSDPVPPLDVSNGRIVPSLRPEVYEPALAPPPKRRFTDWFRKD